MIERKIAELGYTLPEAPAKGGVYNPCKLFNNGKFAYVSGVGPMVGSENFIGKVGSDISFEQARKAAENCMLNVLAVLQKYAGSLDNIKSFVKCTIFISSDNNFFMQPQVANAATELLIKIFGEECGAPSRSAVGVNVLPGNISVEIEMLVELK